LNRAVFIVITVLAASSLLMAGGCDKEKITSSTEYVHDIEYVQLPPDTVYSTDTIHHHDTLKVAADTVYRTDTVIQVQHHTDTLRIHDTVTTVQHHYDTVTVTQCPPNGLLAYTACEYNSDLLVVEFIYENFGYSDGWVYYLSAFQSDIQQVSSKVYDIYGYIDYWTPEFDGYYQLEYYWRMTYTSGDPADPDNWTMSEVPGSTALSTGRHPGLRIVPPGATHTPMR